MKKKSIIPVFISVLFVLTFIAVAAHVPEKKLNMPDDVKVIVDKSCFGCHNTASKNEDAREELDFKKLSKLSTIKKISAFKKIGETIKNDEMPPARFLEKFPDKKLTEKEKQRMLEWSKSEAEALVKSK